MADERDEKPVPEDAIDAHAYEREETTDLKDETPDRPKGWPLHTRILIGLAVGVLSGIAVNASLGGDHPRVVWIVANITEPVGQLFLRLLLMIVVPLVFSSLVVGVAGIGDIRKLGRVGLKSFAYTFIISAISVVIGLTLANTIRPGDQIDEATQIALQQRYGSDASKQVGDAIKGTSSGPVVVTTTGGATASSPVNFTVVPPSGATSSQSKPAAPTDACAPQTVVIGQSINGTLANDCRSPLKENSFYARRYSLNAGAGQQIAISLNSAAFNTALYLIGPSGAVVARNDDGEGGNDSRIPAEGGFYRLPATGAYTIEVTSFAANAAGDFTLRIDASPDAGPIIASIIPPSASAGTVVTVYGANLNELKSIKFNGVETPFNRVSENEITATVPLAPSDSPLMQIVKTLIPSNPIAAIAGVPPNPSTATSGGTPDMLHLMFFALFIGIAVTLIPTSATAPFVRGLDALYQISAKIIDIIMKFAPFAVACLLFNNTARFGLDLLGALAWFIATVLLGLALHMFGVYSLSIYFLSRISPIEFFRRIKTVMLTAFSTSSSNATLPTALRVSEENLGVPREINSFVLTVGATANQNGTALYEGVTVLFLAQLANVDLNLGQQITVAYLAILGGIGTAGVPSGSIPFIVIVLATIGVNPALIAIILGVDRILDMCRTTLNVTGDITAATYVARSEGYELLKPRAPAHVAADAANITADR